MGMERYWKVGMDDENLDKFCSLYGMKRDDPLDLSKVCDEYCESYSETVEEALQTKYDDGDEGLFWKNDIPSAFFDKMASDGLVFKLDCWYEESYVSNFIDGDDEDLECWLDGSGGYNLESWIEEWGIECDDEDELREKLCSNRISLEDAKKMSSEYSSRIQDAEDDDEKAEIDEEFEDSFTDISLVGDYFCDQGVIEGESDGKKMHYYFPLLERVAAWRENAEGWNRQALIVLASYHNDHIDIGVEVGLRGKDSDAYYDYW